MHYVLWKTFFGNSKDIKYVYNTSKNKLNVAVIANTVQVLFKIQILGASKTVRMPNWGAIYYDSVNDKWIDFLMTNASHNTTYHFPGPPRCSLCCNFI